MTYRLGVDLGTTYTAAAVLVGGRPEMLALGNRALQVPTVLFAVPGGAFVVGEGAEQRGTVDPDRLVREFKRRVGDTVPIFVSGMPYSPQALVAEVLRWVVDLASQRQGEPPAEITVTHPASWGLFKVDLLREAVRLADLHEARLLTEPEAAAVTYASRHGIAEGQTVAVYDLGGGTFDAAVLRCEGGSFRLLGEPEGIEHLGGVDFDDAVFHHVRASLGDRLDNLDPHDPAVTMALARLRRDCVAAKEALSLDTEVSIAVVLPGLSTSVRLTRVEFEEMLRAPLDATVAAMGRVLRSAEVSPEQLRAIVLIGGSSRIPFVSEVLTAQFGRPLALDNHPKHDVALGAALAGQTDPLSPPQVVPVADLPEPVQSAEPLAAKTPARDSPAPEPPAPEPPAPEPPAPEPPAPEPPAPEPPAPEPPAPEPPAVEPAVTDAPVPAVVLAPASAGARGGARAAVSRALRKHRTSVGAVLGVLALIGGTTLAIHLNSNQTGSTDGTKNSATTTARPTTPTTPTTTTPAVPSSLDNDYIVWTRRREDTNEFAVFTGKSDGTDQHRLTPWQVGRSQTNISPDRTDVVYPAATGMLRTVPATGKPKDDQLFFPGNVHVDAGCRSLKRPSWSSTVTFIAPCAPCPKAGRCGLVEPVAVYVLMMETGKVTPLVAGAARPTVSSGGRYVAYELKGALYLLDLESKAAPERLTPINTTEPESEPAWSPDGKLAFRRELPSGGAIFAMQVLRGTEEKVVPAAERSVTALYDGDKDAYNPSWSPTGDRLVFRLAKEKVSDLVVTDADGGEPTPLFKAGPGTAIETNWFPTWRTW